MVLIFKHPDDETLYEQLVSRIEHIERAFIVRRHINLHNNSTAISSEVTSAYSRVHSEYREFFLTYRETILWFITVELWSRFTSNSKKGLRKLVLETNDPGIREKFRDFKQKHAEVIGYIDTQRLEYFAHAGNV